MAGTIDFQYDREHDLIVATPHWKLATEADVSTWYGQYVSYMKAFSRKMDMVVVLDDFEVGPAIGAKWGEYRAKVHKEFLRFNVRVHAKRNVKLFVNTSGARFNVSTEEAASVEDGIAAILEMRRTAAAG
jgi:hypothetical protein